METSHIQNLQSTIKKQDISTQQSTLKKNQQCCRICLEDVQNQQIPELCLCKGQNSLVHEKCMLQWMRRAQKYQEFPYTYYYLCDICKTKIYLDTSVSWLCKNWEQIHIFGKSTCCTITTIIVLLLGVAFIALGGSLLDGSDLQALNIFAIIGGGVVIVVSLLIYIFQVILEMELVIHGIQKKKQKKTKKNQIMPSVEIQPDLLPQQSSFAATQKNNSSNLKLNDYIHQTTHQLG